MEIKNYIYNISSYAATILLLVYFVSMACINLSIYTDQQPEIKTVTNILRREKEYSNDYKNKEEAEIAPAGVPITVTQYNGLEWEETKYGIAVTGYSGKETSIKLPECINGQPVTEIAAEAFEGSQLAYIKIPDSVTSIGEKAFAYSYLLQIVEAPGVVVIGNRAFASCKNLAEIIYSDRLEQIGDSAFVSCRNITELSIPETLNYIGQSAFSGTGISEIEIPGTVQEISQCLFADCPQLRTVIFDEGVTAIGPRVFMECGNLKTVYLPSTIVALDDDMLGNLDKTTISFRYDITAENAKAIDKFLAVEIAEMQPIKTNTEKHKDVEDE